MTLQGHTSIYICMTFFLCMMAGLAGYGFVTKRVSTHINIRPDHAWSMQSLDCIVRYVSVSY
jgi:hypothetical protein